MMSAYFSISSTARRVSLSLYQRARYSSSSSSSFFQGTLPASQQLRDDISQAPQPRQESTNGEFPKKGNNKRPKPKLYTEVGGIIIINPQRKCDNPSVRLRPIIFETSLLYDEECLAECDEEFRQLLDEIRKERDSFTQTNIRDVQSGKMKKKNN